MADTPITVAQLLNYDSNPAGFPKNETVVLTDTASKIESLTAVEALGISNFDISNVAATCAVGYSGKAIFAQSEFSVRSVRSDIDLASISPAQPSLQAASSRDIYTRAQRPGFAQAAAKVGPQLQLQYFKQPHGEFLDIGTPPIATPGGRLAFWLRATGDAGLLLVGKEFDDAMRYQSAAQLVRAPKRRSVVTRQKRPMMSINSPRSRLRAQGNRWWPVSANSARQRGTAA